MITDMWAALAGSVEGQFFSAADWERARLEMWFANGLLSGERPLTAPACVELLGRRCRRTACSHAALPPVFGVLAC